MADLCHQLRQDQTLTTPLAAATLEQRVLLSAVPVDAAELAGPDDGAAIDAAAVVAELRQTPSQQDADQTERRRELVIVDRTLPEASILIDEISRFLAEDDTTDRLLVWIDGDGGVDEMAALVEQAAAGGPVDAVHLVTHGRAGQISVGRDALSLETIDAHAAALQRIGAVLSEDADLLLYGCDAAGSDDGRLLLSMLATRTGADVAASDDLTGAAELGGDWVLEAGVGVLDTRTLSGGAWRHTLAQEVIELRTGGSDSFAKFDRSYDDGNVVLSGETKFGDKDVHIERELDGGLFQDEVAFIRFDQVFAGDQGPLPDNAIITQATLYLRTKEGGSADLEVRHLRGHVHSGQSLSTVEDRWETAYTGLAEANQQTYTADEWASFDVTRSLQRHDTGAGYGWSIHATNASDHLKFYAQDDGNQAPNPTGSGSSVDRGPVLVVDYELPEADIWVTTTADVVDGFVLGTPADLAINKGADGSISLREAVAVAAEHNLATGQPLRIGFDLGTGDMAADGLFYFGLTSTLEIDARVEIDGGHFRTDETGNDVIIDGQGLDTAVVLQSGAGQSAIRNLTFLQADGTQLQIDADSTVITGNHFGTAVGRTVPVGTIARNAIEITGSGNRIGEDDPLLRNRFAATDVSVAVLGTGTDNIIRGNYYDRSQTPANTPIQLADFENDFGDVDSGANDGLNRPVLLSAVPAPGGLTRIRGAVALAVPSVVDVYELSADGSFGDVLASQSLLPTAGGLQTAFTIDVAASDPQKWFIARVRSASPSDGGTSPFSNWMIPETSLRDALTTIDPGSPQSHRLAPLEGGTSRTLAQAANGLRGVVWHDEATGKVHGAIVNTHGVVVQESTFAVAGPESLRSLSLGIGPTGTMRLVYTVDGAAGADVRTRTLELGELWSSAETIAGDAGDQHSAQVVVLPNEGFAVAFIDEQYAGHPTESELRLQVYQPAIEGRPLAGFSLSGGVGEAGGRFARPSLAADADGRLAVAYLSQRSQTPGGGADDAIAATRITMVDPVDPSTWTQTTREALLVGDVGSNSVSENGRPATGVYAPTIAAIDDGFAVAYTNFDGVKHSLELMRITADFSSVSERTLANLSDRAGTHPSIAVRDDGYAFVATRQLRFDGVSNVPATAVYSFNSAVANPSASRSYLEESGFDAATAPSVTVFRSSGPSVLWSSAEENGLLLSLGTPVDESAEQRPTARLANIPPGSTPSSSIVLDASASTSGSNPIVQYLWDLDYQVGDFQETHRGGLPVLTTSPSDFDNRTPGTYNVALIVVDEFGRQSPLEVKVLVIDPNPLLASGPLDLGTIDYGTATTFDLAAVGDGMNNEIASVSLGSSHPDLNASTGPDGLTLAPPETASLIALTAGESTGPLTLRLDYTDIYGQTATGREVIVQIAGVDDPPTTGDVDGGWVVEGRSVIIDLAAGNPTDPDGDDGFWYELRPGQSDFGVSPTQLAVGGSQVRYDAGYGAYGSDTFQYRVNTNGKLSDWRTVAIDVTENTLPVPQPASLTTSEDTAQTFDLSPFVPADAEGDAVHYEFRPGNPGLGETETRGQITAFSSTSPTVRFDPATDFAGQTSFLYRISQDRGDGFVMVSDWQPVTVDVVAVNDPPEIGTLPSPSIDEDETYTLDLRTLPITDPEGQPIAGVSMTRVSGVEGTLEQVDPADPNVWRFTPASNASGQTEFFVTVTDGQTPVTASLTLTIDPVNDPPTNPGPITATIAEDGVYQVDLTTLGATDPEGQPISGQSLAYFGGLTGTIERVDSADSNVWTYRPSADDYGVATLAADVTDGEQTTRIFVVLTVNPVNDAPEVTSGRVLGTAEDEPLEIDLSDFVVRDLDGDAVVGDRLMQLTGEPGSIEADATDPSLYTFTPADDWSGTATFEFAVTDGQDTADGTFSIAVNPVNDAPAAIAPAAVTVTSGGSVTLRPLDGMTDVDSPATDFVLASVSAPDPSAGSIAYDETASELTFTAASGYTGSVDITYTAGDGDAETPPQTWTITVVDDLPPTLAVSGPLRIAVDDDGTRPIATLTASDPESQDVTMTLTSSSQEAGFRLVGGELFRDVSKPLGLSESENLSVELRVVLSDGENTVTKTVDVAIGHTLTLDTIVLEPVAETAIAGDVVGLVTFASTNPFDPPEYTIEPARDAAGNPLPLPPLEVVKMPDGSGEIRLTADAARLVGQSLPFSLEVCDRSDHARSLQTLEVVNVNDAPTLLVTDDVRVVARDAGLTLSMADFAGWVRDLDGDAIGIVSVTADAGGTASVSAGGEIDFSWASEEATSSTLSVVFGDGTLTTAAAELTLTRPAPEPELPPVPEVVAEVAAEEPLAALPSQQAMQSGVVSQTARPASQPTPSESETTTTTNTTASQSADAAIAAAAPAATGRSSVASAARDAAAAVANAAGEAGGEAVGPLPDGSSESRFDEVGGTTLADRAARESARQAARATLSNGFASDVADSRSGDRDYDTNQATAWTMFTSSGGLYDSLDSVSRDVTGTTPTQLVVGSAAATVGGSFTVGYVLWTLRSGLLVSGLLAQMPAWKLIDPLVVLDGLSEDGDGESLESMIEDSRRGDDPPPAFA